jgi:hypothetical protein
MPPEEPVVEPGMRPSRLGKALGHGLIDHVRVSRGDSGVAGGERHGGCGRRRAEEDGEGAPHDGGAVEFDVDHVVAALGDSVGHRVGAVAVVLHGAFEVIRANGRSRGDADARTAGGDPAGLPVLGDDGEGRRSPRGAAGDAWPSGSALGRVDRARRGRGVVVGVWRGGFLRRGREGVGLLLVIAGRGGEGLEGGFEGGLDCGGGLSFGLELGLLRLPDPDGLGRRIIYIYYLLISIKSSIMLFYLVILLNHIPLGLILPIAYPRLHLRCLLFPSLRAAAASGFGVASPLEPRLPRSTASSSFRVRRSPSLPAASSAATA